MVSTGLSHVELTVRDLERSLHSHTLIKTPTGEVRSAFSLDPDGMLIQLDEIVEDKA